MRRTRVLGAALALALGLGGCSLGGGDERPAPDRGALPGVSEAPEPVGSPGSVIMDGFTLARGTTLVDRPTERATESAEGWFVTLVLDEAANLDDVVEEYRSQLSRLGFRLVSDESSSDPLPGTRHLRGEQAGTLPGVEGVVPVEVARVDVVPGQGQVAGHVRIVVTRFKASS